MSREQILAMLQRQADQATYGSALLGGRKSLGLRHCMEERVGPSGRKRCTKYMPGMKGSSLLGGVRSLKQQEASALLGERARHLRAWLMEHPGMTRADYFAQFRAEGSSVRGRRKARMPKAKGGCGCCGQAYHHEMPMHHGYDSDEDGCGAALLGGVRSKVKLSPEQKKELRRYKRGMDYPLGEFGLANYYDDHGIPRGLTKDEKKTYRRLEKDTLKKSQLCRFPPVSKASAEDYFRARKIVEEIGRNPELQRYLASA